MIKMAKNIIGIICALIIIIGFAFYLSTINNFFILLAIIFVIAIVIAIIVIMFIKHSESNSSDYAGM